MAEIKNMITIKQAEKEDIPIIEDISVILRFTATVKSDSKHSLTFYVIPQNNWVEGQNGRTICLYEKQEQINAEFNISKLD